MSEKYTRVYHSADLLYAENSPVIITARALLKENGIGNVFAQIKIKSISNKIIKAVRVKIIPLDITGNLIGDAVEYTYLDLKIVRNQEFASKEIISLSEITARAFNVVIQQVVFADKSVWEYDGNEYQKIDKPILLSVKMSDPELVKQYEIELGNDSNYVPMKVEDLWLCTCGNYNHIGEHTCNRCGVAFERENKLLDLDFLKLQNKQRQEQQRQEQQRQEQEKQRTILLILIAIPLVPLICAIAFFIGRILSGI